MSNKGNKRRLSIICVTIFFALAITFTHAGSPYASAVTPEQRARTKEAIAEMKMREDERRQESDSNNRFQDYRTKTRNGWEPYKTTTEQTADGITTERIFTTIGIGILGTLIFIYIVIFAYTIIYQLIKHNRKRK